MAVSVYERAHVVVFPWWQLYDLFLQVAFHCWQLYDFSLVVVFVFLGLLLAVL